MFSEGKMLLKINKSIESNLFCREAFFLWLAKSLKLRWESWLVEGKGMVVHALFSYVIIII